MHVLIRHLEAATQKVGALDKEEKAVGFFKMISLASGGDKCLMIIGWIFSMITGAALPSFVLLFGEVIDTFDPSAATPEGTLKSIKTISLAFTIVGVGVWITAWLSQAFLMVFSQQVTRKTRVAYLKAILRQNIAWFDMNNPQEMGARMSREMQAIQKAIGEKMGTIIQTFSISVAGLAMAFTKGWSFSLVLFACFPPLIVSMAMLTAVMQTGFVSNMVAYSQSAGYAEQALNSMRLVAAFG